MITGPCSSGPWVKWIPKPAANGQVLKIILTSRGSFKTHNTGCKSAWSLQKELPGCRCALWILLSYINMSCEWIGVSVFSYLKIGLNIVLQYQVITQVRMSEFNCGHFSSSTFSQLLWTCLWGLFPGVFFNSDDFKEDREIRL